MIRCAGNGWVSNDALPFSDSRPLMKSFALVISAVLASGLPLSAAEKLVGGPFVVHAGPKSATVAWIVEAGEATLGTEPGKADKSAPVLRAEKVSYTGLQPGATYYYDALGREEGRGSFKTAPSGPADFQFVVYGDTRTRHDMHRRVIAAVLKHGMPDFVMHTGDLVADGADSAQWPVFFDIERELLRHAAFFPSLGNHERNNHQFYDFFDVSTPYYSSTGGRLISSCSIATSEMPPRARRQGRVSGANK
jgi:hypothetical protein